MKERTDKNINPNEEEKTNSETNENIEKEVLKTTNKKKIIFNFVLILAIFVGLTIYMIKVDGIDNIIKILIQADYRWVLLGIICLLIHWTCEAITLHIPIKEMYPNQSIKNSIKVSMIGLLFNNITPFSSGGQPMQAYELTKTGKRVSDSLSAMAIKFIITQIALVVTTLVVVFFEFDFLKILMQNYIWVAILGFLVNIIAIIVVILIGVKKSIILAITKPIIKFLGKIKIFKNPEETLEKCEKSIENFNKQFSIMKSKKKMVVTMFIAAVIQSFAYYSITYTIYRAFGNYGISFWQIIPTQAFLLLIMTFIPTPGSGLGAEGGFYILFNTIFKEGTINMSILFWRLYTFYLPILVGLFFLIPTRSDREEKTENTVKNK